MKFAFAAITAATLTLLSAAPSQANTITYSISGTGTGSLAGVGFSNTAFEFTLVGDSANHGLLFPGTFAINPMTSASFTIGATSGNFQIVPVLGSFAFPGSANGIFFARDVGGGISDLFDFFTAAPIDLLAPIAPTVGTGVFALHQFVNIQTSAGALTFTGSSDVLFSNNVSPPPPPPPAIPEPASWAMLIAGFGLIGATLRRRRQTAVAA